MDATTIMLKEYDTVRQEALTALTVRTAILGFGLATVAGVFTAAVSILTRDSAQYKTLASGLLVLVIPSVTLSVLCLWWGEYRRMQRAGKFLVELESRINKEEKRDLLGWEHQLVHLTFPYLATFALLLVITALSMFTGMLMLDLNTISDYLETLNVWGSLAWLVGPPVMIFLALLRGMRSAQTRTRDRKVEVSGSCG
jgi:hypothetical protein